MASKLQAMRANMTADNDINSVSSKSVESLNDSLDEDDDSVSEAVDDEEEESETENVERDLDPSNKHYDEVFTCEALGDFNGEEKSDLSFKKGDILTILTIRQDGWWEAEDDNGVKGMVPSTFLKVPDEMQTLVEGGKSAHDQTVPAYLWDKLRSTVKQSHTVEEAITAIGGFPIGFCNSSLAQLLKEDSRYTTEAFLAPKLSNSGLSFRDLHWSSQTKSLKPIPTHLQRVIRLVAFRQIHPPSSGFNICSRHVHICLHDGSKVLSNIHTIKAKWDPKVPKIWTFVPKISSSGGSSLEEGQFFVRSNILSPTIGVLLQLCVGYIKPSTGENAEMSCGWVFMRLLNDSGLAVPNRTRILNIHSGVPFMNQTSSPLGPKGTVLKHFMNRSKKPRLVVSISTLKRKTDQLLNFLPSTLINTVSSIPLLVLYRKILADRLLRDRVAIDSSELLYSPFLCNFPRAYNQPDVADFFRKVWFEKLKKHKQSLAKDEEKKKYFHQLFMETAFLILQVVSFTPFSLMDDQKNEDRKFQISKFMKDIKDHGQLHVTLSSEYQFTPLSISNLTLDLIGKHCLTIEGVD